MTSRWFKRYGQGGAIALWTAVVLLIWEAAAWFIANVAQMINPASKLPYLHLVLSTMIGHFPTLLKQGMITFGNSITGFVIGSAIGFLLAILMSLSRTVENTLSPYMVASQMIPIIGLAPIIYGIIHDAALSRVLMAGYVTFFPVTINALRGLQSIKPELLELMRSYAASPWTLYMKLNKKAPDLAAAIDKTILEDAAK